jgi:hypothetical protein
MELSAWGSRFNVVLRVPLVLGGLMELSGVLVVLRVPLV